MTQCVIIFGLFKKPDWEFTYEVKGTGSCRFYVVDQCTSFSWMPGGRNLQLSAPIVVKVTKNGVPLAGAQVNLMVHENCAKSDGSLGGGEGAASGTDYFTLDENGEAKVGRAIETNYPGSGGVQHRIQFSSLSYADHRFLRSRLATRIFQAARKAYSFAPTQILPPMRSKWMTRRRSLGHPWRKSLPKQVLVLNGQK